MAILSAVNLTKVYGTGEVAVKAVDGISMDIPAEDFLGVVGASGSGKSTLLHLLSTLDYPTGGQVLYRNKDVSTFSATQRARLRRRHFGFIFQFYNLVPVLTVEENIALPVLMDGKKPDQEYITHLINLLGLKEKRRTLPHKLSGGQQQRVAIGRALAAKPAVVFADEPTGNLDSATSRDIMDLFKFTAQEFKQTMVIVTHDDFVASNCRRVIEIRDGKIGSWKQ